MEKEVKPVGIPAEITEALKLDPGVNLSTVVANIHALMQRVQTMVDPVEVAKLKEQIAERDAKELVAKAMTAGKITPDQQEWGLIYAKKDPEGFQLFVSKAPEVIPVSKLPEGPVKMVESKLPDETMEVAKLMGVSPEDLKKYGGIE